MLECNHIKLDLLERASGTYFLTGNEALARAALVSGVRYFSSYPGSPITEVSETLIRASKLFEGLHAEYSMNESIAVHGAAGASWSGARSLVTMKHVGIHVSSDPIAYLGYSGTVGGLVLAVGTDPGATCSTGEFDIRHFNDSFHWIMFEPCDVKEVYEYTVKAFEISEELNLPVLIIMPSELCNQYGTVDSAEIYSYQPKQFDFIKSEKYINNGQTAVNHHSDLLRKIENISKRYAEFLHIDGEKMGSTAIFTSGCNYPAVKEALKILKINKVSIISPGMTYPMPYESIRDVIVNFEKVVIIEDTDGYISKHLLTFVKRNNISTQIENLNKDQFPTGFLSMDKLIYLLSKEFNVEYLKDETTIQNVPERPGTFCPGCPHRGILYTLKLICGSNGVYGGDIGCSSLPPYYSDWLTCMGSGLGIAHGVASLLGTSKRIYASMGDSTFFHCGIPIIMNTLQQNINITVLILDNSWTAMTGHQPLPHTWGNLSIFDIVKALGAKNVWQTGAYELEKFRELLYLSNQILGIKIIIIKSQCRLKYLEARAGNNMFTKICKIDEEICHQCGECYKVLGCPAIEYADTGYLINKELCTGCGVCAQICPNNSISLIEFVEEVGDGS